MYLQAARDTEASAQSKVPKRPTFKRPTAKRPGPLAPTKEGEDAQPSKRPRLDALLQQGAAQALKTTAGVQSPHAAMDGTADPQVWSPSQNTSLPYSPGASVLAS